MAAHHISGISPPAVSLSLRSCERKARTGHGEKAPGAHKLGSQTGYELNRETPRPNGLGDLVYITALLPRDRCLGGLPSLIHIHIR